MRGENPPAVGLDVGTSTTLVASAASGVVPIGDSWPWLPSLVGYDDDGNVVVGDAAMHARPEQVVRSIKRAITEGRDFIAVETPLGRRDVRADDLMVALVREAVRRAGAAGQNLTANAQIWLGCPAMWDGRQRRRLLTIAQRAGLPVTLASLVDEPVAAGIGWLGSDRAREVAHQRVLVFDMGGGTLDVAVLDVRGGAQREVAVLAALGIAEAGDALDEAIAEDLDFALAAAGIDVDLLRRPDRARELLHDAARQLKVSLTTEVEDVVILPREVFGQNEIWYTRQQLEAVFAPQLDRAEAYVGAALQVAQLTEAGERSVRELVRTPIDELVESIDVVLLSGGMSHVPYVEDRLRQLFPAGTWIEKAAVRPEYAVAIGLARAGEHGRVNLYRPGFDIVVEWDRGRELRTLYEAYTPLVESRQILRGGNDLRLTRRGTELSLPRQGRGRLRVVSHSGERVRATLGGNSLDGFPVALSDQAFEFSLHPDGRIRMTDAAGTYEGHVEDWS